MPTLNLLPRLPSQRTLMHLLLYPLHLLLVFGIMLYENELPSSNRDEGVNIREEDAVNGQGILLEGHNEEEQMQEPSPLDDEATLEQERSRNDLDQTQEEDSAVRVPLEPQAHPEDNEFGDAQIAEAAGALQELAQAIPTPMVQESLLDTEKAAHEQTRAELAQMKAEITEKDAQLRRSGRRLERATASCEQLRGENNALQTQLDEANELIPDNNDLQTELDDAYEQISNFEVANAEQRDRIASLQEQVGYLSDDAAQMMGLIQTGGKELVFFVGLGTKLYARLNRAEELLKGALGRSDWLMRLAAQRLSVYIPVELYFRDTVVEEEEPMAQLAIEGALANPFVMNQAEIGLGYEVMSDDADLEQLVNEVFEAQHGTAVANGDVAGHEAEGSPVGNVDFENSGPVFSSVAPITTSNGSEPLSQLAASSVEDEGYSREECDANGTAGPMDGNHETTRDQTSANQPNISRPNTSAQNPRFGASPPIFGIFGAQVSADAVPNGNMESGSFNFGTATDFNFGATTYFQAGSDSVKVGSRNAGVAEKEEPKEGLIKKTGSVSMFEAAAGVNLSPSSPDNEKGKAKQTTSISEAAAGLNVSSPSSASKAEATNKTKTTSIFDAAAFVNLSSPPSNNTTKLGASFDRDPKGASKTSKFKFTGSFDFAETTLKGEKGKEPAPVFEAGKSNNFSFLKTGSAPAFGGFKGGSVGASNIPSDPVPVQFKGKGKQKEESTKEAANAPLFTAEVMAKYAAPAPSMRAGFDRFDFGSVGAVEGQPEASSSSSTSAQSTAETEQRSVEDSGGISDRNDGSCRHLEGDHDSLYEYEEGYVPPVKRPATMAQAEMEPASATNSADGASPDSSQPIQSASSAAMAIPNTKTLGINVDNREQGSIEVDGGNPVDDISAGASRISSMPALTREGEVEVESSDAVRRFASDTAALGRVFPVPPVAQENFGREDSLIRQSFARSECGHPDRSQ